MQQEKIATCEKCNRQRMQIENIATCKMKYEIEQYLKRVQHEKKSATWKDYYIKKCNMEMVQHKKVQHEKSATWKKCNLKKYKLPQ